ncbi:MAG: hypothetical protein QOG21_1594 [Actinomycetota bacterium]|nr:hypothetical protein [Actinomycetota bacterium]
METCRYRDMSSAAGSALMGLQTQMGTQHSVSEPLLQGEALRLGLTLTSNLIGLPEKGSKARIWCSRKRT